MQELTIALKDGDKILTVTRTIGENAGDMADAFAAFMLAAGFHPNRVKEIFGDE